MDLLAVHRTLKSLLQHHSSNESVFCHSAFLMVQLSHPYMTTGKNHSLTIRIFVGKVMSLLFNMLSRLVTAFLPRRRLYSPWNSLGQNTGVGSLSLLQGIFPTQGSNPGLPHCRRILYQLSHKGSSRILAWVAYPFSSRSSQPRIRTGSPALQVDSLPNELSRDIHPF